MSPWKLPNEVKLEKQQQQASEIHGSYAINAVFSFELQKKKLKFKRCESSSDRKRAASTFGSHSFSAVTSSRTTGPETNSNLCFQVCTCHICFVFDRLCCCNYANVSTVGWLKVVFFFFLLAVCLIGYEVRRSLSDFGPALQIQLTFEVQWC